MWPDFPLPVIVGIGHERDVTVLDYVAAMRVKTPTAAAEWLIARAVESLDRLQRTGDEILAVASQRISGCLTQLSYYEGVLPTAARAAVDRSRSFIDSARISLAGIGVRASCRPGHLDASARALAIASATAVSRAYDRLEASNTLLKALSPEATMRRGFSVTRTSGGHTVRSVADLADGVAIVTVLADGSVTSVVNSTAPSTHQSTDSIC